MSVELAQVPAVRLTLPDGSVKTFAAALTGAELAASIGPGLAKSALAIEVDGRQRDLSHRLEGEHAVRIITRKDPEALELLRHDAAHVMAEAVKELFPETQVTIGPAIEDGFYYDFARPTPFSPDDLALIEQRMREIVARDEAIVREDWQRDDAVAFFKEQGEHYKAEIIASIPDGEEIGLYRQGGFIDLCRGPHLPSTAKLGNGFKLMKLAGAYWRGDHRNPMLQRIYGTAWRDEKELAAYLTRLEEAEKRDHRRLGREMNLFHQQEEGAGMVFWHPRGWTLYRTLERYMRGQLEEAGYVEVKTPQLLENRLWVASGHWEKFREAMYVTESEERLFCLKPMNCPCHVQIFNQGLTSYRDLPIRMAEFGSCHRYEPSGGLHGIMRVRNFTQDDAHIFCTEDQVEGESVRFCELLKRIYKDLGFDDVLVKFSTRPDVRAGTDETWDKAEAALLAAARAAGIEPVLNPGEGAFYGPKLEFTLRDAIGREWQCGTLQMDFVLPERLGASYIGEDGAKHRPVMLHRAILGTFERFIGILLEHYAGRLPLWLAPVQVVVATVTQDGDAYAQEVAAALKAAGLRAEVDLRNEKIGYKVREHTLAKAPILLAIGKREAEERTVALRRLAGGAQQTLALDDCLAMLRAEGSVPASS
ncbi:threonine--tRNA ligase [Zavarzinia sp. CC-PAN008]|uniref:threonine--tRNA ligase n=1 Tax=Zavarzinia sp. CC-PAN008 TaxID=3243332 RepID=UPI003F747282